MNSFSSFPLLKGEGGKKCRKWKNKIRESPKERQKRQPKFFDRRCPSPEEEVQKGLKNAPPLSSSHKGEPSRYRAEKAALKTASKGKDLGGGRKGCGRLSPSYRLFSASPLGLKSLPGELTEFNHSVSPLGLMELGKSSPLTSFGGIFRYHSIFQRS